MIVILMGVTGSGKTSVGEILAADLGWTFLDADQDHPAANIAKMRRGDPLTDADRWPWLDAVAGRIRDARSRGENVVLACSALKHDYRDYLRKQLGEVTFIYLHGSERLLQSRLDARKGHFMNPVLLRSQLDTLEPPNDGITVDVAPSPPEIATRIRRELGV
jgi:gluconokinase